MLLNITHYGWVKKKYGWVKKKMLCSLKNASPVTFKNYQISFLVNKIATRVGQVIKFAGQLSNNVRTECENLKQQKI